MAFSPMNGKQLAVLGIVATLAGAITAISLMAPNTAYAQSCSSAAAGSDTASGSQGAVGTQPNRCGSVAGPANSACTVNLQTGTVSCT